MLSMSYFKRGVCGAELEYITSRARIVRLLEDMDPNWRSRDTYDMVERLLETRRKN
jgi:hypothetical protein